MSVLIKALEEQPHQGRIDAFLSHFDGGTSAAYLSDWLKRAGTPVGATTIKEFRRTGGLLDARSKTAPGVFSQEGDDLYVELLKRPIGVQRAGGLPIRAEKMRILLLDIETYPALTWTWSLWSKFTPINMVKADGGLLSWAAKWYAEDEVQFASLWGDGEQGMAERMHALLCEADAVVTYNGNRFDLPKLRTYVELESGLGPTSPFASIDLYNTVKQFSFLSNKLAYVVNRLEIGQKVDTGGFGLWTGAMPVEIGGEGDPEAQAQMEFYNRGDVVDTLEPLYDAVLPWIKNHPHVGLYAEDGSNRCQRCGSLALVENGRAFTPLGMFRRYQCDDCKSWSRGKTRIDTVDARAAA